MKTLTIAGLIALGIAGLLVFSACGGQMCTDFSKLRFLQARDDIPDPSGKYRELLNDPRFAKIDAFGVSGFIDGRAECSNYKRAAESLSLLDNNVNNSRSWESKIEAVLIYDAARQHGCNID